MLMNDVSKIRTYLGNRPKLKKILAVGNWVLGTSGILGACWFSAKAALSLKTYREENPEADRDEIVKETLKKAVKPGICAGVAVTALTANTLLYKEASGVAMSALSVGAAAVSKHTDFESRLMEVCHHEGIDIPMAKYAVLHKPTTDVKDGQMLFYEATSDRYFVRTEAEVYKALLALNDRFSENGWVSINYFLEQLELSPDPELEIFGWDSDVMYGDNQVYSIKARLIPCEDDKETMLVAWDWSATKEGE